MEAGALSLREEAEGLLAGLGRGWRGRAGWGTEAGTLAWLQTVLTWCSLSSDSCGLPRYCCSSACRMRMEKGTMEPGTESQLRQLPAVPA